MNSKLREAQLNRTTALTEIQDKLKAAKEIAAKAQSNRAKHNQIKHKN